MITQIKYLKKYNFLILLVVFGLILPFSVFAEAPVVETQGATHINLSCATLNGEITDHGRYALGIYSESKVWFEYGTNISYGHTTPSQNLEGLGSFSQEICNLSSCALYHFRAVAENPSEKAYGIDRTFMTKCPVATELELSVKNVSQGEDEWQKSLKASPSDKLVFKLVVTSTGTNEAKNIMVKDDLPSGLIYQGNLTIGGVSDNRDISADAVDIGNLLPGRSKTLSFEAQVASEKKFDSGTTPLINTAIAYIKDSASSDSCTIIVTASTPTTLVLTSSAGVSPADIKTAVTGGILNSILFPLAIAFVLVWMFSSKLIGLDEWMEKRKKEVEEYRVQKKLKKEIAKLKAQGY